MAAGDRDYVQCYRDMRQMLDPVFISPPLQRQPGLRESCVRIHDAGGCLGRITTYIWTFSMFRKWDGTVPHSVHQYASLVYWDYCPKYHHRWWYPRASSACDLAATAFKSAEMGTDGNLFTGNLVRFSSVSSSYFLLHETAVYH